MQVKIMLKLINKGLIKGAIKDRLRKGLINFLNVNTLERLSQTVITLNDYSELKKIFDWDNDPVISDTAYLEYCYPEDVNNRRLHDAQSLATVARNAKPSICLDVGTSLGYSAALIAENAKNAKVYTVNIPPENFTEGGEFTTHVLETNQIGSYYRKKNLSNIEQILTNTKGWIPPFGPIDLTYIDGCHDTDFVYSDSRNAISKMEKGSFILWHDFNPSLVHAYKWIYSVCRAVDMLIADGIINGRIYHIQNSWTGIYRLE